MGEDEKEQIKAEIKKVYNVFLKNKIKNFNKHITYYYDIAKIDLNTNHICFRFNYTPYHLHLNYDGEIANEIYPFVGEVGDLRERLKLLKKLAVSMI
jgi:hypothetical protein